MLVAQFGLSLTDAQGIVQSCPECQGQTGGIGLGVNPRGLQPLQLWQMDVPHVPSLGRFKYVHVCIDTFSGFVGETARRVIVHRHGWFAAMGVPLQIKADNAPGYTSSTLPKCLATWGISHTTGIPHSPTGRRNSSFYRAGYYWTNASHFETIVGKGKHGGRRACADSKVTES